MSVTSATLINGQSQSFWSVHDRGLQYGDGLFETLTCIGGRLRWFEYHMARLALGCERLGMRAPDRELLHAEVQSLLASAQRALIKIILTRGVATARGYRPRGDEQPTRIVSVYDWQAAEHPEFRLGLSSVPLGANPKLAGLKHLNRLEQVLAQQEASARGWHEVLMRSSAGEVISGSMSNLFVCQDGEWLTPPVTQCGIAGIMRALVLERAPRLGLAVRIASLSERDVHAAPALCVTNVRLGLQPVHWYQDRALAVDQRGARLQELIDGTLE
ncbi:MAG TPA: aminodeoxychorismate lyase [Steroidobacteraceae bacterium]|nr:aminodeoxychorismate lyase [Steroidobacteraceae bacterium]